MAITMDFAPSLLLRPSSSASR